MSIFWKRKDNQNPPWTQDPILQQHKFTNVYRFLDRESQYLIFQIINPFRGKEEDLMLTIILYKIFNKYQTWEQLLLRLGMRPTIQAFDPPKFAKILSDLQRMQPIFNNAYMMTGASSKYDLGSKHETRLTILKKEFIPLIPKLLTSKSLRELYENLRQVTFFWPFIAMQFAIDLNYSPIRQFDENEFILAWIGARRGIKKCFDSFDSYEQVIHWVLHNFDNLMQKFWLTAHLLPTRKPTLIDLQNCFCETDKYLRVKSPSVGEKAMRIKQKYTIDTTKQAINYTFPTWRLSNFSVWKQSQ